MKTTRGLALGVVGVVMGVVGCGADAGESEADLTANKLVLTAPTDAGLSFALEMFDGVKASTKDQRFTKLTAKRGKKSFSLWCSVSGQLKGSGRTDEVSCSDYAETVSNDDDESLSVTFARTQTSSGTKFSVEYDYSGDGTIYGAELAILRGKASDLPSGAIALKASGGGNAKKDPFAMAEYVDDALEPMQSEKIVTPEVSSPTKVNSIKYDLSTKLEMTLGFRLGNTGAITYDLEQPVSILDTPGKPSAGLESKSGILARVKDALSGAPTTPTIDAAVGDLEEIFSPGGRHDEFGVSSATPTTMVHQYIDKKYEGDAAGFTFVTNETALSTDEEVAGTLKADAARDAVLDAIDGWVADSLENPDDATALRKKAEKLVDGLIDAGAAFGFDGWEQNGCAAPTPFLLVLDTKNKMVYGIDLNPCIE